MITYLGLLLLRKIAAFDTLPLYGSGFFCYGFPSLADLLFDTANNDNHFFVGNSYAFWGFVYLTGCENPSAISSLLLLELTRLTPLTSRRFS